MNKAQLTAGSVVNVLFVSLISSATAQTPNLFQPFPTYLNPTIPVINSPPLPQNANGNPPGSPPFRNQQIPQNLLIPSPSQLSPSMPFNGSGIDNQMMGNGMNNFPNQNSNFLLPGGQMPLSSIPGNTPLQISPIPNSNFGQVSGVTQMIHLQVPVSPQLQSQPISPVQLPQLLTGASGNHATTVTVNQQGQILLTTPPNLAETRGVIMPNLGAIPIKSNLPGAKPDRQTEPLQLPLNEANNLVIPSNSSLNSAFIGEITSLEQQLTDQFSNYFGQDFGGSALTTNDTAIVLNRIYQETGTRGAVVYVIARENNLDLVILTEKTQPKLHRVDVSKADLLKQVKLFQEAVTSPRKGESKQYLIEGQALYQLLIQPLEAQLQAENIDTILFSLDAGLRSLPLAALYDGQQYLIEKYRLSLIPSMSLLDTRYQSIQNTPILAMGASQFLELSPLPAVELELNLITQSLREGHAFINQEFTKNNLIRQRQDYPYQIIHLATHSEFRSGLPENSYIQLWQTEKLRLNQLRQLGWNKPPVELLVLSSCRSALGDEQAELGFAGLAVQAGVKSALASLWYVSDEGTLALMVKFYNQLNQTTTKAEALQKAQIAMLKGEIKMQNGQLKLENARSIPLPEEFSHLPSENLSHPYYWSAFTLIGSPW